MSVFGDKILERNRSSIKRSIHLKVVWTKHGVKFLSKGIYFICFDSECLLCGCGQMLCPCTNVRAYGLTQSTSSCQLHWQRKTWPNHLFVTIEEIFAQKVRKRLLEKLLFRVLFRKSVPSKQILFMMMEVRFAEQTSACRATIIVYGCGPIALNVMDV